MKETQQNLQLRLLFLERSAFSTKSELKLDSIRYSMSIQDRIDSVDRVLLVIYQFSLRFLGFALLYSLCKVFMNFSNQSDFSQGYPSGT
ncbi:uncharacterized protein LOC129894343 isoform X2 [Solanum dulcamara]|uniref:uncharacterized protein LOC129894343 isoform X2 n=1 Tax=Solanum dulcamara TaxID=45834 RepID=UPI00248698D6|nr:uncharacterized protein LOC129894343 isoform X2 [Solanum dulcamara]